MTLRNIGPLYQYCSIELCRGGRAAYDKPCEIRIASIDRSCGCSGRSDESVCLSFDEIFFLDVSGFLEVHRRCIEGIAVRWIFQQCCIADRSDDFRRRRRNQRHCGRIGLRSRSDRKGVESKDRKADQKSQSCALEHSPISHTRPPRSHVNRMQRLFLSRDTGLSRNAARNTTWRIKRILLAWSGGAVCRGGWSRGIPS